MALVSVIIPVYNRSEQLVRAITSVMTQTYSNFEILVIDDHSTINIKSLVMNFPVSYIKSERKGVSAARNTGIKHARGEFIAFLDSDDEWLPTKLATQVDFFYNHPDISLVHSNEIWKRGESIVKQLPKHKKMGGRIFSQCTELCLIGPSCTMVRRSLVERLGVFDETFLVCEDYDLWLRIASAENIGFINEPLTIKHGGHADQLSTQFHSMDIWRVRALVKHLGNTSLTIAENKVLRDSIRKKLRYLIKGARKHNNSEALLELLAHTRNLRRSRFPAQLPF